MHRGTSDGCLSLVRLCLPSAGVGAGGKETGAGGGGMTGSPFPLDASPGGPWASVGLLDPPGPSSSLSSRRGEGGAVGGVIDLAISDGSLVSGIEGNLEPG
eukprot:63788-Pyramimonas_sp.AAC.2